MNTFLTLKTVMIKQAQGEKQFEHHFPLFITKLYQLIHINKVARLQDQHHSMRAGYEIQDKYFQAGGGTMV